MSDVPILWHIPVSHYSEKVRWALDYKGVRHERKAPMPGAHMLLALARTRGRQSTFPVMKLNGRSIGDSTAIIAALEAQWPQPPLYPAEPTDRARALELEEWFDEELAPHLRLLAFHEIARDKELVRSVAVQSAPGPLAKLPGGAAAYSKAFVYLRYRVHDTTRAQEARRAVLAAMDKLERELGEGEYLAGGAFSVADLSAAALFYPLVQPAEGPRFLERLPEALERFREPLKERRGYRWVEEMFRRHRNRGGAG